MAPGLEEELVFQVMNKGNDRQYLSDKAEALRSLDFKVDDKKIETALKKYELMQAYNSQDNSRRAVRKRERANFEKFIADYIERMKENDPTMISGKAVITSRGMGCPSCKKYKVQSIKIRRIHLVKFKNLYDRIEKEGNNFDYCRNCGYFKKILTP